MHCDDLYTWTNFSDEHDRTCALVVLVDGAPLIELDCKVCICSIFIDKYGRDYDDRTCALVVDGAPLQLDRLATEGAIAPPKIPTCI